MSDGARSAATPWRRPHGGRFKWVASSPSPAVVVELERLYSDIVQVPMQSLKVESCRWVNQAIIDRSSSRWIPPEVIVREFHRARVPDEIEALALAHRHYMFWFIDPRAKRLVLGRPWVANGQPIAVVEWQPEFVPADDSLLHALLWIRLPQLPIEFWTDEILSSILSVAGQFLFSDESDRNYVCKT